MIKIKRVMVVHEAVWLDLNVSAIMAYLRGHTSRLDVRSESALDNMQYRTPESFNRPHTGITQEDTQSKTIPLSRDHTHCIRASTDICKLDI
jgi:hypothetical protein